MIYASKLMVNQIKFKNGKKKTGDYMPAMDMHGY
jgi:hypothetical protein